MKILIFDTETTGLPSKRNASINATHQWPYIIQLSYILYDTKTHQIETIENNIVKIPESVNVSPESVKFHKITKEKSQNSGIDIIILLKSFNNCVNDADCIVAHNLDFDKNMIMVECLRNKITHNFLKHTKQTLEYCTMKNSVDLCKIKAYNNSGNEYYKYPKLSELYKYIFGYIPDGLHNSIIDVLLCLRCYGIITKGLDYCIKSSDINTLFEKYLLSSNNFSSTQKASLP